MRRKHSEERWREYYEATERAAVRNLLLAEALRLGGKPKPPVDAIDIGCGYGADTLTLLEKGYRVYAFDGQAQAIRTLRKAILPAWRKRFRAEVKRFEEIRKRDLPSAALVNASYSLFFCPPSAFPRLWRNVTGVITEGGIFVGHFIGPNDDWARKRGMTAVTRARLRTSLLRDFEILRLTEAEDDSGTVTGKPKHWHLLSVIARKKGR